MSKLWIQLKISFTIGLVRITTGELCKSNCTSRWKNYYYCEIPPWHTDLSENWLFWTEIFCWTHPTSTVFYIYFCISPSKGGKKHIFHNLKYISWSHLRGRTYHNRTFGIRETHSRSIDTKILVLLIFSSPNEHYRKNFLLKRANMTLSIHFN
jgi:hypothetical protein